MTIARCLYRIAHCRPLLPSFSRKVEASDPKNPGIIDLHFYVPPSYKRALVRKYPVVINFHGGGFVLGKGIDDSSWASVVIRSADVVFVNVEYRLAPEYPFPVAVDDGTDAVLYLVKNAESLGLDVGRMALTGFSAGGNLAFTVPLRLRQRQGAARKAEQSSAESLSGESSRSAQNLVSGKASTPPPPRPPNLSGAEGSIPLADLADLPAEFEFCAVAAWYPRVDFTVPRQELRRLNSRPDKHISPSLTNLFDDAYLFPEGLDLTDPMLSPAMAPEEVLQQLPDEVIIFSCEWDMLCSQDQYFAERLRDIGKTVKYRMIKDVPHAWDKSSNPFKMHSEAEETYTEACHDLVRIFSAKGIPNSSGVVHP